MTGTGDLIREPLIRLSLEDGCTRGLHLTSRYQKLQVLKSSSWHNHAWARSGCAHVPLLGCWLISALGLQVSSLVQLYVDMEHTGRNAAFYEKFSTRHMIGQILRTPAYGHKLCHIRAV